MNEKKKKWDKWHHVFLYNLLFLRWLQLTRRRIVIKNERNGEKKERKEERNQKKKEKNGLKEEKNERT